MSMQHVVGIACISHIELFQPLQFERRSSNLPRGLEGKKSRLSHPRASPCSLLCCPSKHASRAQKEGAAGGSRVLTHIVGVGGVMLPDQPVHRLLLGLVLDVNVPMGILQVLLPPAKHNMQSACRSVLFMIGPP